MMSLVIASTHTESKRNHSQVVVKLEQEEGAEDSNDQSNPDDPEEVPAEGNSSPTNRDQPEAKGRFVCVLCGRSYSKRSGLCRHKRRYHSIGTRMDENGRGVCRFCGICCNRHHLSVHERSCEKRTYLRRRQYCTHSECPLSFFKKEELIDHLTTVHNDVIEPMRKIVFNAVQEFKLWKEKEEDRTYSFFSKHTGTKKGSDTFYCQHDGSGRIHRSNATAMHVRTKQNKKGRIKHGKTCISFIRTKLHGDGVIVNYWPTHSHPLSPEDVKHHPISEGTFHFIKEQIMMNIPSRQIQAAVRKKLAESDDAKVRDTHITLKRINSLAKRIRGESTLVSSEDAWSTFVDTLIAQDDSPIILYKPACVNILSKESVEDETFHFLGIQTGDQQEMLQRAVTMPMFIGVDNGPHTFNNYLVSVVVPCEENFEYPVGHLITSQMNVEAICLFLQAIGERCPELNVNCIVSEDYPELHESIKQVFGEDGPYFLSKWHFLKTARKMLASIAPPGLVEELCDYILAMGDAESEERFMMLYSALQEQFEISAPNVLSVVSDFVSRAVSWASCYRQFPGIVDSSLFVDSFHNKVRKLYRRRPVKTPTLLLDLLLYIQEDYREKRKSFLNGTYSKTSVEEEHSMALDMLSNFVQGVLFNHWSVTGSKSGQEFNVIQCLPKCIKENCKLQCHSCVDLCSHMYYCTCTSGRTICKHVHKVHLENSSLLKLEGICEQAGNNEQDTCENDPEEIEMDAPNCVAAVDLKSSVLDDLDSLKKFVEEGDCSETALNMIKKALTTLISECSSEKKDS